MLLPMLKAQWISLKRDRLALFLVFVLPVIFFSVFAVIFGGGAGGGSSRPANLKVTILDLDKSKSSMAMLKSIQNLESVDTSIAEPQATTADKAEAEIVRMVRTNSVDAAIIFPPGLEGSIASFGGDRPAVKVIYDAANPIAQNMLTGVLQGSAFAAAPEILIDRGLQQFRTFGGPFSTQQEAAVQLMTGFLGSANTSTDGNSTPDPDATKSNNSGGPALSMNDGLTRIETASAQQASPTESKTRVGSMIAYYAASVAVMFLMFSMAGSASALLEHQERGTLERLISGQMSIVQLLFSHWAFFVITGIAQLIVMFAFAAIVFKVNLTSPPVLLCCGLMTIATSMASASFIIMLATMCRSRKQLESISTTLILIMSAFGGSMVPRPFLPEFVKNTSKLTFNGWALDGFLKVLWYYDPTQGIVGVLKWHLAVILFMSIGFFLIAALRAKRWTVA